METQYDIIINLTNKARVLEATGKVKMNAGRLADRADWTIAGKQDIQDAKQALRHARHLLDGLLND